MLHCSPGVNAADHCLEPSVLTYWKKHHHSRESEEDFYEVYNTLLIMQTDKTSLYYFLQKCPFCSCLTHYFKNIKGKPGKVKC